LNVLVFWGKVAEEEYFCFDTSIANLHSSLNVIRIIVVLSPALSIMMYDDHENKIICYAISSAEEWLGHTNYRYIYLKKFKRFQNLNLSNFICFPFPTCDTGLLFYVFVPDFFLAWFFVFYRSFNDHDVLFPSFAWASGR
jgi:hypothetical protein